MWTPPHHLGQCRAPDAQDLGGVLVSFCPLPGLDFVSSQRGNLGRLQCVLMGDSPSATPGALSSISSPPSAVVLSPPSRLTEQPCSAHSFLQAPELRPSFDYGQRREAGGVAQVPVWWLLMRAGLWKVTAQQSSGSERRGQAGSLHPLVPSSSAQLTLPAQPCSPSHSPATPGSPRDPHTHTTSHLCSLPIRSLDPQVAQLLCLSFKLWSLERIPLDLPSLAQPGLQELRVSRHTPWGSEH